MTKDIELLEELKGRLVDKMVIESRRTFVNANVINKCDEYIGALSNAIRRRQKMTEKLGVLLVDVPEPRFAVYHFIYLSELGFMIKPSSDSKIILDIAYQCTEEEAKKHPQFKWVALEELK